MNNIIEINQLCKQYDPPRGAKAVNSVTFNIQKGEIFSLLGPNGSGKTTMIGMLSGLLVPTAGDAMINGDSVIKRPHRVKQHIGVVPQEIALYSDLSAHENLEFWGKIYGLNKTRRRIRIAKVLEITNLADRADEKVAHFSSGMQRRLNIAVGILHSPSIVYMDEPTVGIDPQSRRRILDTIKTLSQQGMTILYTTHYMEEAEELSDRIGIIDKGHLIAFGTQAELTENLGSFSSIRFNLRNGTSDLAAVAGSLSGLSAVHRAYPDTDTLVVETQAVNDALPGVINYLNQGGLEIQGVTIKEPNLESLFLHLTGRALRD